MVKRQHALEAEYQNGAYVPELMPLNGTGIVTKRDNLTIHESFVGVQQAINDIANLPEMEFRKKYGLPEDVRDWQYSWAKKDVISNAEKAQIAPISYRPFDDRFIYYSGVSRGFVGWPVPRVMGHIIDRKNLSLHSPRQCAIDWQHCFVAQKVSEFNLTGNAGRYGASSVFPLYLYPDEQDLDQSIRVNFDPKLYAKFRKAAGLTGPLGVPDPAMVESGAFRTATGDARPDEVKVFDYIYGVLHCPAYRETYAEFLKIDFPRVPFPPSPEVFRTISEQGEALRRLHLMEDAAIGATPYPFDGQPPEGFDSVVDKPRYENGPITGRVYINGKGTEGQYFDAVPPVAWNFPIGGYQPAQKWLKDRKGRALSYDDIRHYQKIIKILAETDRIMAGIAMPLGDAG
jgi:hypothetical protein